MNNDSNQNRQTKEVVGEFSSIQHRIVSRPHFSHVMLRLDLVTGYMRNPQQGLILFRLAHIIYIHIVLRHHTDMQLIDPHVKAELVN